LKTGNDLIGQMSENFAEYFNDETQNLILKSKIEANIRENVMKNFLPLDKLFYKKIFSIFQEIRWNGDFE
jgi:hypothetical protein